MLSSADDVIVLSVCVVIVPDHLKHTVKSPISPAGLKLFKAKFLLNHAHALYSERYKPRPKCGAYSSAGLNRARGLLGILRYRLEEFIMHILSMCLRKSKMHIQLT